MYFTNTECRHSIEYKENKDSLQLSVFYCFLRAHRLSYPSVWFLAFQLWQVGELLYLFSCCFHSYLNVFFEDDLFWLRNIAKQVNPWKIRSGLGKLSRKLTYSGQQTFSRMHFMIFCILPPTTAHRGDPGTEILMLKLMLEVVAAAVDLLIFVFPSEGFCVSAVPTLIRLDIQGHKQLRRQQAHLRLYVLTFTLMFKQQKRLGWASSKLRSFFFLHYSRWWQKIRYMKWLNSSLLF